MRVLFDWDIVFQTFGGIGLFAVVIFVFIIFYRRESKFSIEYVSLLDQYRERNQELEEENHDIRIYYEGELLKLKNEYDKKIKQLEEEVESLHIQLNALRSAIKNGEI